MQGQLNCLAHYLENSSSQSALAAFALVLLIIPKGWPEDSTRQPGRVASACEEVEGTGWHAGRDARANILR